MPDELSDTEIWARLQNGRQDALLVLYDKYYVGLINYGIILCGDHSTTHDCITQILLRLWDRRKDLPPVQNLQPYLVTCLRHELIAERKAQQSRTSKTLRFFHSSARFEPSYEEYLIQKQSNTVLKEKLVQTLQILTPREKELLRLKFFENLDYSEISIRCSITKRTAYNIVHAALKTLKSGMTNNQNISLAFDISLASLLILFFGQNTSF